MKEHSEVNIGQVNPVFDGNYKEGKSACNTLVQTCSPVIISFKDLSYEFAAPGCCGSGPSHEIIENAK